MLASTICRITATFLTLIAATSCVAPVSSIVPGPAYSLVMEGMDTPAETRVFVANQHPISSYPGCVVIATGGFARMGGGSSKLAWARREGQKLKADIVIVHSSTSGGMGVIGLTAMRLAPSRLGFSQANWVVAGVMTDNARDAGLTIGDQIMTINGVPAADLFHEVMRIQPGDLTTFEVRRDGQTLEVQFAAMPNPPVHLDLAEASTL